MIQPSKTNFDRMVQFIFLMVDIQKPLLSFNAYSIFFIITGLCLLSCSKENAINKKVIVNKITSREAKHVSTFRTKRRDFQKVIYSNGKVNALQKSKIPFRTQGIINKVYIKNGQRINKGDPLAKIEDKTLLYELNRIKIEIDQALLEQQSQLLGLGYTIENLQAIPEKNLNVTALNSGLTLLNNQLALAVFNVNATLTKAPFDGIVCNLQARQFNSSTEHPYLCTLINDNTFTVSFTVLEAEYSQLSIGQHIAIDPLSFQDKPAEGKITDINPSVDQNGLIKVHAKITKKTPWLLDGINVKVTIVTIIKNQIVLPKEAILNRQEKSLVFVFEQGLAKWIYVKTGLENEGFIVVEEGLAANQMVILNGNISLVHDDSVVNDSIFTTY